MASAAAASVSEGAAGPPEPLPKKKKLHGRAFYESLGSPKYIVAPMVDQSEFAWRMLTRSFLPESERSSVLAYSPMLHARLFADSAKYREAHFEPTRTFATDAGTGIDTAAAEPYLDGNPKIDRPLIVQFCANDPDALLAAARLAAPHCDAVDINLGCPQGIARKGHYGAFLQEDQELIFRLINTLHENLDVPVTAKIRVLETREATLAYARNVLRAGASFLTVHGRRREQKGHLTGLADWAAIRHLRENLPPETVLFANGNVLRRDDLERCLRATGADGVMSAEGNLSDPGLFAPVPPPPEAPLSGSGSDAASREYWRGRDGRGGWRVDAVMRRYLDIIHRYALGREPPARRPLFIPGDDTAWLSAAAEPASAEEQEKGEDGEPARKKRRKMALKEKREDRSTPNFIAVQAHLFHLLRHFVSRHHGVRDALARAGKGDIPAYESILAAVERRVAEGLLEYERTGGASVEEEAGKEAEEKREEKQEEEEDDPDSSARAVQRCRRPWWVAQPIIRPLPKEALAKGAVALSKKQKMAEEAAAAATAAEAEGGSGPDGAGKGEDKGEKGEVKNGDVDVEKTAAAAAAELERSASFPRSELVSG